jgi:hypothetical protein
LDREPFAPCGTPVNLRGLSPGTHTFRAYALLSDGRFDATPAAHAWEIITTPLETTIGSAPPAVTTSLTAVIAFRGSETEVTFECALDAAAFAACTSPQNLSGLTAGAHRFRVRAVDGDGIRDETPAEVSWTIDATAPAVQFLQAPTEIVEDPQVTFVFQATEESARLFCRLDAAAFAPCQSPHTLTGLTAGTHQFAALAEDAAGNRSAPEVRGFTVQWRLGAPCSLGGDCRSGFCRDGVCCNEACADACRSCALVRGTCTVVRNFIDPDSCSGTNMCDDNGTCGPRSGQVGLTGFEFSSANYRFRGEFPAGSVQLQSGQYRFEGKVGVAR